MSVLVECPACESRFELNSVSSERENGCPTCQFTFDVTTHVCDKNSPEVEINKLQTGLPQIPAPRCLEEFVRRRSDPLAPPPLAPPKLKPPKLSVGSTNGFSPSRPPATGLLVDELNGNGEDSANAYSGQQPHHDQPLDRRRELAPEATGMPTPLSVVFGIVLCLISVAALAGIIFMLVHDPADEKLTAGHQDSSTAGDTRLSGDERDLATQESIEQAKLGENALTVDESVKSATSPQTGNTIYDRIWEKNAAYLLQVDFPAGGNTPDSMMALAIDRRGWVLTNLQGLFKHPTAEISGIAAPAWNQPIEFMKLPPPESLTAALPDFDLCVLQLPPAALPATEIVVDADFDFEADVMLYAIAPAAQSVTKPFVKCRIFNRQQQSAVPASVRAQLEERGFAVGQQFRWILHDGQLKANSCPCPLFSETGELVAIHLMYDDQTKTGYAIPARIVMDFRNSTVGEIALAADVPAVKELTNRFHGGTAVTVAKVPMNSDFPVIRKGDFAVIDRAKELFDICDGPRIDWLAKTPGDYQQLQSFANLLAALDETVMDETIDLDRRTIFESEADTLYDKISTVQWPTLKQIEQQNQFAVAGLEIPGQPFFAYVQVDRPVGLVSVGTLPVAVCTIIGTEKQIILPIVRGPGEVRINSQWLVLGRDDPDQRVEAPGTKRAFMSLIRARRLVAEPR